MTLRSTLPALGLFLCHILPTNAALTLGLLDDFEDGTLGGWETPVSNTSNVAGGPAGSTRALQIDPSSRLAAFDEGINGVIDPAVTAISVDMMRMLGTGGLEIRLVLFGPGTGNRWTSTLSQIIPNDGNWNTYTFSILQSDLTQVLGSGTYASLNANLDRIMFRYDTGAPSSTGTPVSSSAPPFFIDNVTAIPEPSAAWLLAGGLVLFGFRRHPRARRGS